MSFLQPKFEYNIEDKWTILKNNRVGSQNRGEIADEPTSGELVVDSAFMSGSGSSLGNLQEIIDYADGLSYTTITIDLDAEYDEINLVIPSGMTIQAENGRTVIINIKDFISSRHNYSNITSSIKIGGTLQNVGTLSSYSPAIVKDDYLYYYDENGDWNRLRHASILGKEYVAITLRELALVNNTSTSVFEYYHGNTRINSDMETLFGETIDITNPCMRYVRYCIINATTMNYGLFFRLSDIYKVGYIHDSSFPPSTTNNGVIRIQREDGGTFTNCEYWDFDSIFDISDNFQLSCGLVNDTYTSYIYFQEHGTSSPFTSTAFQSSYIEKTIETKLMKVSSIYMVKTGDTSLYLGGQQIWSRNSTGDYELEHTFDFDVTDFDFFLDLSSGRQYNTPLYCMATNTNIGMSEIWKKDLLDSDSVWVLVKRFNLPLKYMWAFYFPTRIVLYNTTNNQVYHFIPKTVTLESGTAIKGIEINNDMKIVDLGIESGGRKSTEVSLLDSDYVNPEIQYCTINSDNIPISNNLWKFENCILKSEDEGIYFRKSTSSTFTGDCQYNLIIVSKYALKHNPKTGGSVDFSSATFQNNTIYAGGGLYLNNPDDTELTIRNLIINANNIAVYVAGNYNPITISNSIINGIVDIDVTLTDCYRNTAPLFKDIDNENFELMSIAENYPKNSIGIGNSHDGSDLGCYDTERAKLPLLQWGFQETSGTTAYDSGILDKDGEIIEDVSVGESGVSSGHYSYQFGGSGGNGYVATDSSTTFKNTNDLTISFWLYWTRVGEILKLGSGTGTDVRVEIDAAGTLFVDIYRYQSSYTYVRVDMSSLSSNWLHIIIKISSDEDYALLKVNNVIEDIEEGLPDFIEEDTGLYAGGNHFNGYMENIMLFNYITSEQNDINLYNNGNGTLGFDSELDKKTIEFENYKTDISYNYELPYSKSSFDYFGNYKKYVGEKTKVLTLLATYTEYLKKIRELENLTYIENSIRFYPFSDTGEKFLLHYNTDNNIVYEASGTLFIDTINLKAYTQSDYFLQIGTLKNGYLKAVIGSNEYYFRIIDNSETVIELDNINEYSGITSSNATCSVLYYYVKTDITLKGENAIWDFDNQKAISPVMTLYAVKEKD